MVSGFRVFFCVLGCNVHGPGLGAVNSRNEATLLVSCNASLVLSVHKPYIRVYSRI